MNKGVLAATASYRPTAFYWRRALRETNDQDKLRELGLALCSELEFLRQWAREHGMKPPKQNIMQSEAVDMGWELESSRKDSAPLVSM